MRVYSKLKNVGFIGPYSGARHQFINYQHHRLAIPTNNEYSIPQLRLLIREVERIIGRNIDIRMEPIVKSLRYQEPAP